MRVIVAWVVLVALSLLAPSFSQAQTAPLKVIGSDAIIHIGLLVPDVQKTVTSFVEIFGVPTAPIVVEPPPAFPAGFTGDRQAHLMVAKLVFANVVLEVAQPMGGASPWREFLDTYGQGLHHLAFTIDGLDDHVRLLQSKGGTRIVGAAGGDVAVVDMMATLGINLELHAAKGSEPSLPGAGERVAGLKTISRVGLLVAETDRIGAAFAGLFGVPVAAPINEEGFFPDAPKTGIRDSFIPFRNMWVNAIQPLGGESVWRDMVERHAGYLNFFVDDVDAVVKTLESHGGMRTLGAAGMPFAYVNMEERLGVTILLLKSGIMAP